MLSVAPQRDSAAIHKKLVELEQRLELTRRELQDIRALLRKGEAKSNLIMTPQVAHSTFLQNPSARITVEFGVIPGSGTLTGDDPAKHPIHAVWDYVLQDNTHFEVVLTPAAFRALKVPSKDRALPPIKPAPGTEREMVINHIQVNGLRVTGVLEPGGRQLIVSDPANVVLYLAGQPGSEVYWQPE